MENFYLFYVCLWGKYEDPFSADASNICVGCFFFCLTDKRRPNAPPDSVPALSPTPCVGEV